MTDNQHKNGIKCPIWNTEAKLGPSSRHGRRIVSTRAGGEYTVTGSAESILSSKSNYVRAKLTTWLVSQRFNGVHSPLITSEIIESVEKRDFISFDKKIENFFRAIKRISPSFDFQIFISRQANDVISEWYSAYIEVRDLSTTEFWNFMQILVSSDYFSTDQYFREFRLNAKGWQYLDNLNSGNRNSDKAFVAMWFDDGLKDVYTKQISSALVECGYVGEFRIDQVEHINKIDDQIMAKINESSLVVVDLTCPLVPHKGEIVPAYRGGVYFEAGYAMGLDIPIIWTCKKDNVDHIHFDLRQFNQFLWYEEGGEYFVGSGRDRISFEKALVNRITAINMNRKIRYS